MRRKLNLIIVLLVLGLCVMIIQVVRAPDSQETSVHTTGLDDIEAREADNKSGQADNDSVQADIPSIKDVYKDNFLIGAAVAPSQLTGRHAELLKKHYNSIVAENVMKWDATEPTENKFTFENADKIRNFAVANGMKMRGHTLLWHSQIPDWVFQKETTMPDENNKGKTKVIIVELTNTKEDQQILLDRLENHIKQVVTHFGSDIYAYDVVNEVIDPEQEDGFRRSKWYRTLGSTYIDKAFEFTRKYAPPGTKLFINDYGTETNTTKRQFYYNLVKDLKDRGIPIDGVGHQFHINMTWPPTTEIKQTFKMFADLGVENQVTELDISVYSGSENYDTLPQDIAIQQGKRYEEIFNVFKESSADGNLTSVTLWGIADDHTWKSGFGGHPVDFPLPFDNLLQVKPAYWGMIDPAKLIVEQKTLMNNE